MANINEQWSQLRRLGIHFSDFEIEVKAKILSIQNNHYRKLFNQRQKLKNLEIIKPLCGIT